MNRDSSMSPGGRGTGGGTGTRRRTGAAAFGALALVIAAFTFAEGCSGLSFIKRRLPPPYRTDGGILFQFASPSARVVQLAGNWPENNWLRGQGETARYDIGYMSDDDGDGVWQITVELPPGRYQYKFRIDEINWKEDPNNPQKVDDGFGGFNSLLIVD